MRGLPSSSREAGNHPKECDPQKRAPIHLTASRLQLVWDRAKHRSRVLTDSFSARRSVGRSQDVIKKLVSDCILTRQAQIIEHPPKGVDQVLLRSLQRLHRDIARQKSTTRPRRKSGCHRYIPLKNSGSRITSDV